jgi:hypothetical protein
MLREHKPNAKKTGCGLEIWELCDLPRNRFRLVAHIPDLKALAGSASGQAGYEPVEACRLSDCVHIHLEVEPFLESQANRQLRDGVPSRNRLHRRVHA